MKEEADLQSLIRRLDISEEQMRMVMHAWEEKGVTPADSGKKGAKQMRLEIASMFLAGQLQTANNYRRSTLSTLGRLDAFDVPTSVLPA
jgi:hypothetical protein